MKRDMELIRAIALATEALAPGATLKELKDLDANTFATHVLWMHQAGLVQARVYNDARDTLTSATVVRLTWEGCEFVDAARNDTLWNKAVQSVVMPSASFTFGILKDWLAKEISQSLPTIGG